MATLNELNALREYAGMKPLKVWKASKAALQAAIDKLQSTAVTAMQTETVKAIEAPVNVKRKTEGVSISEIAKSLGMNDKVARAKLRRRTDVPRLEGKAWSFAEKDVAKVKEILKQDNRKKGGAT